MKPLSERTEELLRTDEIKYATYPPVSESPELVDYVAAFETRVGKVVVNIHVDDEERSIRMAASMANLRACESRYAAAAREIMKRNHLLIVGFFLINPENDSVELVVTGAYPDMSPSMQGIRRLLQTAIFCFAPNYDTFVEMLRSPQDVGPSPEEVDEVGANLIGFAAPDDAESPETPGDSAEAVAEKPARRRRRKQTDDQ